MVFEYLKKTINARKLDTIDLATENFSLWGVYF
jgi:hypothetical protein